MNQARLRHYLTGGFVGNNGIDILYRGYVFYIPLFPTKHQKVTPQAESLSPVHATYYTSSLSKAKDTAKAQEIAATNPVFSQKCRKWAAQKKVSDVGPPPYPCLIMILIASIIADLGII